MYRGPGLPVLADLLFDPLDSLRRALAETHTTTPGAPDGTAQRSKRRALSPRHTDYDCDRLPDRASSLSKSLNTQITRFVLDHGVTNENFDQRLSAALHQTLPVEGRTPRLDGAEYAVLAVKQRLRPIYERLETWDEAPACVVLDALQTRWMQMVDNGKFTLDLERVPEWLDAHKSDDDGGEAVAHCIALDAPTGVRVEKRLAQAGAQKRVFQASWTVADDPTEIVIKEFLGESERILIRERRPHPLSMTHPNIIETFTLDNEADSPQTFLVERRLDVMNDRRRLSGLAERARLLVDIARALAFLDHQGLVHGDVKPDNIGLRDGRFVLLDFGICRPAAEFIGEAAQTGSLRTRAPEILLGEHHHSPKSDVWALGATMFNLLTGQFPLLNDGETPPHPEHEKNARARFENKLRRRIRQHWADRLQPLEYLHHHPLRNLVQDMLELDPMRRPDAAVVLRRALKDLVSLVGVQEGPRFAVRDELDALRRHLAGDRDQVSLLPDRRRKDLEERLKVLQRALRAQRHYQTAANRVAVVADVEILDPLFDKDAEKTARLESVSRLTREFRTPTDQANLDLLSQVRRQLEIADPPENTQQPVLLDALRAALLDAKDHSHDEALDAATTELIRVLPES